MNVLIGDGGGPDLAALGDVLFENGAANRLRGEVVARNIILLQHILVPVFERVERAVQ